MLQANCKTLLININIFEGEGRIVLKQRFGMNAESHAEAVHGTTHLSNKLLFF